MARGEHLKNPVVTNNDAIIRVQLFTREGKQAYIFECKNFMSNTHPTHRERIIREALEAKLGKLNELPVGSKSSSED